MTTLVTPRARAEAAAERAVRRSGAVILEVRTPSDAHRAAELLREVWRGPQLPVPANLVRTVQYAGGYVFGAYDDAGTLLAVSVGLLAQDGLHSHITGVVPKGQRRGLGYALKQHQRAWALERGMSRITWTCDPLVRRNVLFNVHALGAEVVGYLVDHYGPMEDGVNKGDASDRLGIRWELLGDPALAAGEGRLPFVDAGSRPRAVEIGPAGLPVVRAVPGAARVVSLPPDIEALRRGDPAAGHLWRRAVRDAVVPAMADGAVVLGLSADGALVLDKDSHPPR